MDIPGTLYLVGTPVGNLEDITLRARRVLREVALIAAEDTRVTRTLLQRYEIRTRLISYHEHSGPAPLREILEALRQGKSVAFVTDAGMPGVSDPGAELVQACAEAGLPVTVVPGPTAASAALALSGLATKEYLFLGFLPARAGPRREALLRVKGYAGALILYEAPHRVRESLDDLLATLGDRPAACGRELTKHFEEVVRGPLSELIAHFAETEPRGEFTLVVAGAPAHADKGDLTSALAEVGELMAAGLSVSRAVAHVAKARGVAKSALYRATLEQGRRDAS